MAVGRLANAGKSRAEVQSGDLCSRAAVMNESLVTTGMKLFVWAVATQQTRSKAAQVTVTQTKLAADNSLELVLAQ